MSNYPDNFDEIKELVRQRDGDICSMDNCENIQGEYLKKMYPGHRLADIEEIEELEELRKTMNFWSAVNQLDMVYVVLQTSHKNHDTKDNRLENLQRICQICHMIYDAKRHGESKRYGIDHRDRQTKLKL